MCFLRLSKNIVPFTVTFLIGIFVVSLFNCFASTRKINKTPFIEVYELKHCPPLSKKEHTYKYKKETNIYSLQRKEEKRIVKPTFEQTIIINKKSEKLR